MHAGISSATWYFKVSSSLISLQWILDFLNFDQATMVSIVTDINSLGSIHFQTETETLFFSSILKQTVNMKYLQKS